MQANKYFVTCNLLVFLIIFPCVQIVVWRFLLRSKGSDVLATKQALLYIILLQYIPRFFRVLPLTSELKRTAGVFAETAWAGAAYYLLLYMLASHVSYVWFNSLFLGISIFCSLELSVLACMLLYWHCCSVA